MDTTRKALFFSFSEKYALITITLFSFFVIARLLTPQEVGINSIAAAIIALAQVVREFGVGNYLIQKNNLSDQHIGTALGFSLLLGLIMFAIMQLGAPLAGTFYAEEKLVNVIRIISINFLLLPLCSISISLLRREMKFSEMMIVNIIAALCGTCVTLLLAWNKHGAQSLAWGSVTSNLVTGIGAWFIRGDKSLILPSLKNWREIARFGGYSTFAAIVTSLAMNINDLAVGKVMGVAPVAILSRAQGVMNLMHSEFIGAIRNVAYPVFANLYRSGKNIETHFIITVTNITAFAWPFYGFVALYPLEILRIMFGPQWDESASLLPIFAAAGAFSAVYSMVTSVMLAVGRVELVTKSELVFQPLRAGIIVFSAITFKTLTACALGFLASFAIALPIYFIIKNKCVPNDSKALLAGLVQSIILSLIALSPAGAYSFYSDITRSNPINIIEFCIVIFLTALTWLFFAIFIKHPLTTDPLFRRFFSRIMPCKKNQQ